MELNKAWLYRQGNWTEVDDPAAQFPEEIDNLFEVLHYSPESRTYGVAGEHSVAIYYGPLFPKEEGPHYLSRLHLLCRGRWSDRPSLSRRSFQK